MTTVSHDGYFGEEREPLLRRWYSNAPGHISLTVVRRDLEAYRQLRCGECGRRGPRLTPQHTLSGCYRILAQCRHCGAEQVL
jgi:hypothetical protein